MSVGILPVSTRLGFQITTQPMGTRIGLSLTRTAESAGGAN